MRKDKKTINQEGSDCVCIEPETKRVRGAAGSLCIFLRVVAFPFAAAAEERKE